MIHSCTFSVIGLSNQIMTTARGASPAPASSLGASAPPGAREEPTPMASISMEQLSVMVVKAVESALTTRGVLPAPLRAREEEVVPRCKRVYGEMKNLRAFLKRFNQAALKVPSATLEVKINTLTNDLRDGDLFSYLVKKPVQTFDELLKRAEKYVTLEEVNRTKKADTKSSTTERKKEPASKWSSLDRSRGPDPEEDMRGTHL
ncbi:hypothetical protein ACS0TY_027105 [Phlomoides rotata]